MPKLEIKRRRIKAWLEILRNAFKLDFLKFHSQIWDNFRAWKKEMQLQTCICTGFGKRLGLVNACEVKMSSEASLWREFLLPGFFTKYGQTINSLAGGWSFWRLLADFLGYSIAESTAYFLFLSFFHTLFRTSKLRVRFLIFHTFLRVH